MHSERMISGRMAERPADVRDSERISVNRRVWHRTFGRRQLELRLRDTVSGRIHDTKHEGLGERLAGSSMLCVTRHDDETDRHAGLCGRSYCRWRHCTLAVTTPDLRAQALRARFWTECPARPRFAK